jgi:hypothetical protein
MEADGRLPAQKRLDRFRRNLPVSNAPRYRTFCLFNDDPESRGSLMPRRIGQLRRVH